MYFTIKLHLSSMSVIILASNVLTKTALDNLIEFPFSRIHFVWFKLCCQLSCTLKFPFELCDYLLPTLFTKPDLSNEEIYLHTHWSLD
jgi:hypothetical protein